MVKNIIQVQYVVVYITGLLLYNYQGALKYLDKKKTIIANPIKKTNKPKKSFTKKYGKNLMSSYNTVPNGLLDPLLCK